jgi:rare lipoprotein A
MDGRRTASGDRFDSGSLTAAHPTLPFGTRLRVTNLANGRSVIVRVNDRGGFRRGYLVRLTRRAARELGFTRSGSTAVGVEVMR